MQEIGPQRGSRVRAADNVGRTLVAGDVDNDGDVDLLVTNNGAAPELLRNESAGGNAIVRAAGGHDAATGTPSGHA